MSNYLIIEVQEGLEDSIVLFKWVIFWNYPILENINVQIYWYQTVAWWLAKPNIKTYKQCLKDQRQISWNSWNDRT